MSQGEQTTTRQGNHGTEQQANRHTLAQRLALGEVRAALTFAGQGQTGLLDELAELLREVPEGRAWLEAATEVLEALAQSQAFRSAGLYGRGLSFLRWVEDAVDRPEEAYVTSSAVSQPLIFLTQMLRYQATFHAGLGQALARGAVPVVSGHSQGMMPALLVAESDGGRIELPRLLDYVRYFAWQGLHMARSFRGGAEQAGPVGSPMLAVAGPTSQRLQAVVARVNQVLPLDRQLAIALYNTRTRHVVSGPVASIDQLRAALTAQGDAETKQKREGKFAGKPLQFVGEALVVGAPFHSTHMQAGLEGMRQAVREIGFRIEGASLRLEALSPSDGRRMNDDADLTDAIMVDQFVRPVRWADTVRRLVERPGVQHVIDLGPSDGVGRLTRTILRGSGLETAFLGTGEGRRTFFDGAPDNSGTVCYADDRPGLVRLPNGAIALDNRYTRATGLSPFLLPGMTPTTGDAPIIAAAANAGYVAELAGGGQPTEKVWWTRMEELAETLEPGREFTVNTLLLDPWLWDLQVKRGRLIQKARKAGFPIAGVTVSAGIPEVADAVALLDELAGLGMKLNAFKPGTVAQVEHVVKIAKAAPQHTIFIHIEGGKAGGHHSWEELDDLLLDTYDTVRRQPNLVLCVGGGIATEARATELLTGKWSEQHGLPAMPVDAVFLGTLAMACREACTSPQVKQALVDAQGTDRWVHTHQVHGGVTSGRSQLDADIHYLDNAAARCGRLLDQVAGDADAVAKRRDEILAALALTSRPYFGDLERMTWAQVLQRMVDLMTTGTGGRYDDGVWPDRSYRERVADTLRRAEARLAGRRAGNLKQNREIASILTDLAELDDPHAVLAKFAAAYPEAATTRLHTVDARFFVHKICARPGKPVCFVPVLDGAVRRWFKADSLWTSHDPRYPADAVLIIPGPEAVQGIFRADEPVADLLGRFDRAAVEHLLALGVSPVDAEDRRKAPRAATLPAAIRAETAASATVLHVTGPVARDAWLPWVASTFRGPLAALCGPARLFEGTRPAANPVQALLFAELGATLRVEAAADGIASLLVWQGPGRSPDRVVVRLGAADQVVVEVQVAAAPGHAQGATYAFSLQRQVLAGGDTAFLTDETANANALGHFYHQALFGRALAPTPLFASAAATVSLSAEQADAYRALTGGAGRKADEPAALDLAFSLGWEPLFQVLSCDELAEGLLRLVHLENRIATGPGWPVQAGEAVTVTARATRVEDADAGRTLQTTCTLLRGKVVCATVESAFFVRGSYGRTPLKLRADEPVTLHLLPTDAPAVELLRAQPWVRWEAEIAFGQPLSLSATLGETRPRKGLPTFRAQGALTQDGRVVGTVSLNQTADLREHPVRAVAALLAAPAVAAKPATRKTIARTTDRTPFDMAGFAEVGRDLNPIHRSAAAARLAGLDEPIVHGMWTAARTREWIESAVGEQQGPILRTHTEFLAPALRGEPVEIEVARTGLQQGGLVVEATASVRRGAELLPVVRAEAVVAAPRTAYVFPGQGIQQKGMGMEGYARSPAARAVWDRADAHAREHLGFSILRVVRDNPRELIVQGVPQVHPTGVLNLTQFTQVAMAVLATAQVAELEEAGALVSGAVACGHSVGEYNALSAYVRVLPIESVVDIVYQRGCVMHTFVPRDAHGRSAYRMGVIRPNVAKLNQAGAEALVAEIGKQTGKFIQIVNYNVRDRQYSVTGEVAALEALEAALIARGGGGKRPAWVEVPGIDVPFHSAVLREGVPVFRATLDLRLPKTFDPDRLVGKYVPNLVPLPFSLEIPFIQAVFDATSSPELAAVLTNRAAWLGREPELARLLLVELLAWQFASPVRWIETQELLMRPVAEGGLGMQQIVEVGVGYQPTLLNMARQSAEVLGPRAAKVALRNVEANADTLFARDTDEAPAASAAPVAPAAPVAASTPVAAAPVAAPVAAASSGPIADSQLSPAEALKMLLALQAKVRPDQISDTETIDELFQGVSSRRNQALLDIGAEFQAGTLDGAHEKPLAVLAGEIAKRAGSWKAPGRYLRAAEDEALKRVLGRSGLGRKDIVAHLADTFGIGEGVAEQTIATLTLETRDSESGRGGALGELAGAAPGSRAEGLALVEQAAGLVGKRRGFALGRAGSAAGGSAVDAAVVRELEERIAGAQGVLMQTARDLAGHLGLRLEAAGAGLPEAPTGPDTAAILDKELGRAVAELIAPAFDRKKHVAFLSSWAFAQRDVAKLAFEATNGRLDDASVAAEAARLQIHGGDERVQATAQFYAGRARQDGNLKLAAALDAVTAGSPAGPVAVRPSRPRLDIAADGTMRYSEQVDRSDNALATFATSLWPRDAAPLVQVGAGGAANDLLRKVLEEGAKTPFDFAGRTAVVTGASPGSIALEIVRHLLRGGARVVVTTSTYDRKRLRFYGRLFQQDGAPGAELHVVPFNQASFQDIDGLVDWLFAELAEQSGATVRVLKRPWAPDLLVPFAALKDLGTLDTMGARSEAAVRAQLLGVERLIVGIAARHKRDGLPHRPCHVLLPLSPNHGNFGGDGAYAETKIGLEVLLPKWKSEAEAWGRATTLCGARIGWVRGTGLMDANDPVAARLEEQTGVRTFASAEMGWILAGLCTTAASDAARLTPVEADVTGGFGAIGDVKAVVEGIRKGLDAESTLARRRTQLGRQHAERLGQTPPAAPTVRPLPAWPRPDATPPLAAALAQLPVSQGPSLADVVVIVGTGEIGPLGSSRTRHEVEVDGELSAAGVLELAWVTGLVRYVDNGRGGVWQDVASGEEVDEADLAHRYRDALRTRVGIRWVEPATAGFDPSRMPVYATVFLERDFGFTVQTEAEAYAFQSADPKYTRVERTADGEGWRITRLAGAEIRVPKQVRLDRLVVGQVPQGLDFARYGIPRDMVERVDRVTLFNLVATVDAFLSAGLEPEELLRHLHPARIGNTQGAGLGGMQAMHRLYLDPVLGNERQNDTLQETLINVVAAYVVQAYVGSYGAMAHPVGACATAAVSLEEAFDKISGGRADFVVAGGFDDYGPEGAIGFADMNATASSDEMTAMGLEPDQMSRANDVRRRGFVEAHGGGTLLLARGDVALRLGLPVHGVLAYASSHGDGIHKSIPAPGLGVLACAAGGMDSPLGRALGRFGLTADDIALVYKHDTSTGANDPNENALHHRIQQSLGRTPGLPLFAVSQKALTGHSKGGAAAWQAIGLCQALTEGVVPGNRNLESVDEAMRKYRHIGFSDATLRPGPAVKLRAGLLTSLGFGHVGAIGLVLHPDAFHQRIPAGDRAAYAAQVQDRAMAREHARTAVLLGDRMAFAKRSHRRFAAADGTDAQVDEEARLLLDPNARLDVDGLYHAGTR